MTSKLEMQSKYYNNPNRPTPPPRPVGDPYSSSGDPMQRIRSAETVNMSVELFEKLYLSQQRSFPQEKVQPLQVAHGDWRKGFGNPTPM
jgi:hypothetical protein